MTRGTFHATICLEIIWYIKYCKNKNILAGSNVEKKQYCTHVWKKRSKICLEVISVQLVAPALPKVYMVSNVNKNKDATVDIKETLLLRLHRIIKCNNSNIQSEFTI